jgi:hypothetical protein
MATSFLCRWLGVSPSLQFDEMHFGPLTRVTLSDLQEGVEGYVDGCQLVQPDFLVPFRSGRGKISKTLLMEERSAA